MTKSKKPKVVIVIVTYNSGENISKLFKTLHTQTYEGELGITVVDNNSKDDTLQYLQTHEKSILILPQNRNTGFAVGVNIGIDSALKQSADAVILLNDDTYVASTFVERLVDGAFSSKDIATAQALLLLANDPNIINTAGNSVHYLGFGYGDKYKKSISSIQADGLFDCTYGSGAALLIKRESIEQYGKLIESYFMYHEDLEYGIRMLMVGKRNVVIPASHVYHNYSFEKSILKFYFMERNRHIFMLTHYSLKTLALLFPIYIVTEIALFIASFFAKTTSERLHIWAYFFKYSSWKKIVTERKMMQTMRTVEDSRVVPYLRDGVYFQDVDTFFARYIANPSWKVYWKVIKRFI